ncbi:MAG: hypothetical protein FWD58_04325 [Firmicutes bacterium]|nr:hypothetical protein [Bacillota bacterium]
MRRIKPEMRKQYWISAVILLLFTFAVNGGLIAFFLITKPPPILDIEGIVEAVSDTDGRITITVDGKEYGARRTYDIEVGDHVKFMHEKGTNITWNWEVNGERKERVSNDSHMGYSIVFMGLFGCFVVVGLPLIYCTIVHFVVTPKKAKYAVNPVDLFSAQKP